MGGPEPGQAVGSALHKCPPLSGLRVRHLEFPTGSSMSGVSRSPRSIVESVPTGTDDRAIQGGFADRVELFQKDDESTKDRVCRKIVRFP